MKNLLLIVLAFLLPEKISAQVRQIDAYLQQTFARHVMPGFAVTVVKDNTVLFSKGYGVAQTGSLKPFTPHTVSAIGSLTKSFTTLAILQLAEKGKLQLDTPVIHYLPWFCTANKQRSDKITVRMLLNNTSGLQAPANMPLYEFSTRALEQLTRKLSGNFLTRDPGTAYEYSNAAFCVAGLLVSQLSGKTYQEYIRSEILAPLQMNQTTTDPAVLTQLQALSGHYPGVKQAIPALYNSQMESGEYLPAGSLMSSSAADLGKYLMALLNGGNGIISRQSIRQMWTPEVQFPGMAAEEGGDGKPMAYGLGWMLSGIEGRSVILHGGSTGTMSSLTMIDTLNHVAASMLMNIDLTFTDKYRYASEITILNNVMRLAIGQEPSAFGVPTVKDPTHNTFQLPDSLYQRYTGSYTYEGGGPFLLAGAGLQIDISPGNQLQGTLIRGKQIVSQFTVDFVNEALAVSRNIAQPLYIRFKLSSKGQVKEVFLQDMRLVPAASGEEMPAGITVLRHTSASDPGNASFESAAKTWLQNYQIQKKGIILTQKVGAQNWQQQSFVVKKGSQILHLLLLQTRTASGTTGIVITAPEGQLTSHLQQAAMAAMRQSTDNF